MSVLSSESGASSADLIGDVDLILIKSEQKQQLNPIHQEMRDGSSLGGLSAKATEFVSDARNANLFFSQESVDIFFRRVIWFHWRPGGCGGAFQGLSSKATEYVPVSEFKTEGASEGAEGAKRWDGLRCALKKKNWWRLKMGWIC